MEFKCSYPMLINALFSEYSTIIRNDILVSEVTCMHKHDQMESRFLKTRCVCVFCFVLFFSKLCETGY